MLSCFLPCYMFGLIAKAVGEDCLLYGVLSAIPFINWYFCTKVRTDIRTEKKIDVCYPHLHLHWHGHNNQISISTCNEHEYGTQHSCVPYWMLWQMCIINKIQCCIQCTLVYKHMCIYMYSHIHLRMYMQQDVNVFILQGTVLNDFLVTTFCTPCALSQEAQVWK